MARAATNRGGPRQANAALYRVVIVRMRSRQPTFDYASRLTAEGKSKPEIIRCLKRFVVREILATSAAARRNRAKWPLDPYRSINVFIERLWRSLKHECVYLHAFETGSELRVGLHRWIGYDNGRRPHSSLGGLTPDEAYAATAPGNERLAA